MRSVVYSVASSLDGFIAGPKGEFDWIPMDPTFDWAAFMGRFDTILIGRKTYELTQQQQGGASAPDKRTYVFSRTLRAAEHPKVTIVAGDEARVVNDLRREKGKDIWLFGGGVLFRSLLELGLVDRVEVGLVPILLGGGLPLLPETTRRTRLRLVETKPYEKSGIVLLSYDVVGKAK